jgi:hypothetical protein
MNWSTAFARKAILSSACALAATALGGCTVLMTAPERPTAAQRVQGLSFSEALAYLDRARTSMRQGLSQVDQWDAVSRGAVGVGIGGAAIAALARGSSDAVLGLLTLAGTGYSINQTSGFPVQAAIFNAGLDTLECIERTGYRVNRDTATARRSLQELQPRLNKAVNQLAADLAEAKRRNSIPADVVARAERALAAARDLQKAIGDFLRASDAGAEMYFAVNKTVEAVNRQLRAHAPNVDEIAKAGSMLTGFVSANANIASGAAKSRTAVTAASQSAASEILADMEALDRVVQEVQMVLPAPSSIAEPVSSCQSLLPGQGVFTVTPSGPIELAAGGEAYDLSVESDLLPLYYGFHGTVPSAQQLVVSHPSDRIFSLAAPAGAKEGGYKFYIYQKDGRKLPDIDVVVAGGKKTNSNPGGAKDRSKPPKKLSLAQRRKLLGLASDVKETDAAWKMRVQKLENCFQLPPSDGTLGDALTMRLQGSEPVNSAGDCPKPKQPSPAISQPAGTPPVPKPPSLGAGEAAPAPKPGASG